MHHSNALAALLALLPLQALNADVLDCADGPPIPITSPTCGELAPPTLSCRVPADVEGL